MGPLRPPALWPAASRPLPPCFEPARPEVLAKQPGEPVGAINVCFCAGPDSATNFPPEAYDVELAAIALNELAGDLEGGQRWSACLAAAAGGAEPEATGERCCGRLLCAGSVCCGASCSKRPSSAAPWASICGSASCNAPLVIRYAAAMGAAGHSTTFPFHGRPGACLPAGTATNQLLTPPGTGCLLPLAGAASAFELAAEEEPADWGCRPSASAFAPLARGASGASPASDANCGGQGGAWGSPFGLARLPAYPPLFVGQQERPVQGPAPHADTRPHSGGGPSREGSGQGSPRCRWAYCLGGEAWHERMGSHEHMFVVCA